MSNYSGKAVKSVTPGRMLLIILLVSTSPFSGDLTGSVRSTGGTVLASVKITATCTNVCSDTDSAYTNTAGEYRMTALSMGAYLIGASGDGYYRKDTSIVMGDAVRTLDLLLEPFPDGSVHGGEENGVWLPEGNPHRLTGDVKVNDSLYIAPGCSVIAMNSYQTFVISGTGRLRIGALAGKTTYLSIGCPWSPSDTGGILELLNARIVFPSSGVAGLKCGKILIDSVSMRVPLKQSIIQADTLVINKMHYAGYQWTNGAAGHSWTERSSLALKGSNLVVANSLFDDSTDVFTSAEVSEIQSSIFVQALTATSDRKRFKHCNIGLLICPSGVGEEDTLQDNIIGGFQGNSRDSILRGKIQHCLIGSLREVAYFGLLLPIRTNTNGDSCDLWFNMSADPLFTDETRTILTTGSPAIGAASDGTNIGWYQGPGIMPDAVQRTSTARKHPLGKRVAYYVSVDGRAPVRFAGPEHAKRLFDMRGRAILPATQTFARREIGKGIYVLTPIVR